MFATEDDNVHVYRVGVVVAPFVPLYVICGKTSGNKSTLNACLADASEASIQAVKLTVYWVLVLRLIIDDWTKIFVPVCVVSGVSW